MPLYFECVCRLWNTRLLRGDAGSWVGQLQARQLVAHSGHQTLKDQASASLKVDRVW